MQYNIEANFNFYVLREGVEKNLFSFGASCDSGGPGQGPHGGQC